MDQQKIKNPKKKEDDERVGRNPLRDLPEWFEKFTENLVDDSVPEHRDAPSSSRESSSDSQGKVVSGKHSIYPHFPRDGNCDICLRTKITRAPCRKRTGTVVPRAEHFGDLVTADDTVLSEGCESRHNHRYAVVVQDLATQWIQSYPCEHKLLRKRKRACKSSWSRRGNQKSLTLTCPKNFANLVKIFPGIVPRQHRTDRKLMGLLREQCAESRKGHLRSCCNQVWTKNGGRIPWNVTATRETFKISCLMGRHPMKGGSQ